MLFSYIARKSSGSEKKGVIDESDLDSAFKALNEQGLTIIEITNVSLDSYSQQVIKLTNKNKEVFLTELASLLDEGVQLEKSLGILSRTFTDKNLQALVDTLLFQIRGGSSFNAALSGTRLFSKVDCALIELAEASGTLAKVLVQLAKAQKDANKLRQKVIQALTYPSIILFVCISTVFFVFNFIVPNMSSIFADAEVLPWYTVLMLATSDFFIKYQFAMLIVFFSIISGIAYYFSSFERRLSLINMLYLMPIFSKLIVMVERIRFTSSMHLALGSGVKLEKALQFSVKSIVVNTIADKLSKAIEDVSKGHSLAQSLSHSEVLNEMQIGYIEVAEEIGSVPTVFEKISKDSKDDFDSWVMKATALLEPLLIIFMGLVVGGVVIIMMLSIMSIQDVNF